mgnify:CR=1 FL=1
MAFTVKQAAYLMGLRESTVKEMIASGKLLTIKGTRDETENELIHDSEMSRFQHPWEHIFRLDERINAQQALVETLKAKINDSLGTYYRSDVQELTLKVEAFHEELMLQAQNIRRMMLKLEEPVKGKNKRPSRRPPAKT